MIWWHAIDAASAGVEMPAGARQALDDYANLVIDHDPVMRFLRRRFGAADARERASDMFFGK